MKSPGRLGDFVIHYIVGWEVMMDISHNKFVTPRILSGSTLKIIATIAMVANHVGIIILGAITE